MMMACGRHQVRSGEESSRALSVSQGKEDSGLDRVDQVEGMVGVWLLDVLEGDANRGS